MRVRYVSSPWGACFCRIYLKVQGNYNPSITGAYDKIRTILRDLGSIYFGSESTRK